MDLTAVTFIDSTGLGLLVGSMKRARAASGDVKIVAVSDRVLKVFRLTGLERAFVICASVKEAVRGDS